MTDQDYDALYELASEFDSTVLAARFIRAELDCGLPGALHHIERVVTVHPDSALAQVHVRRPA